MATRKRVRKHSQRGMHKKFITGKKPISAEEKATRKKAREAQSAKDKAAKIAKSVKVVKKE